MAQYRKKPVVIEAVRIAEVLQSAAKEWKALPDWVRVAYDEGNLVFCPNMLYISTLEGKMEGGDNDWLLRGVKGEIYPCKNDIFEATYEPI